MAVDTGFRVNRKFLFLVVLSWVLIVILGSYYNGAVISKFEEMKIMTTEYIRQSKMANPPPPPLPASAASAASTTRKTTQKPVVKVPLEYVTGFKPKPIAELQNMDLLELHAYYMKLITVPTIHCGHVIRYGNRLDGGWEVCQDEVYKVKAPCLVYSMGINWDFSFDDAISKSAGCVVHSFDPSMKTKSFNRSNLVRFHNYGLKGKEVGTGKQSVDQTAFQLKNFDEVLTSLNHKESTIDFFKMDIEGPEWNSMELMLTNNLVSHIRQFAFEVHVFIWEFNSAMFIRSINILERMREAGFEIFLSHQNPMGIYLNPTLRKRISCCYELYFLNTKYKIGKVEK